MTSTEFKDRYRSHKKSFNNYTYKAETTLSQHIWKLKSQNIDFDEKWKILDRARPFSPVTGVCPLCTLEKFYIISFPEEATLNKNDEIFKPCLHRRPLLLDKTWFPFGYWRTLHMLVVLLLCLSYCLSLMAGVFSPPPPPGLNRDSQSLVLIGLINTTSLWWKNIFSLRNFRHVNSDTLQNIQVSHTPLHTKRTTNLVSNLGLILDQVEQNSLIHWWLLC